jgi:thiazole synthase
MLQIGDRLLSSRLILGTAQYPNADILRDAIKKSGAELVTVSLRRQGSSEGDGFWSIIRSCGVSVLPNTAGCRSAREAIITARLARELFGTNWIKLETVGDDYTLQPDPFALVEAAEVLLGEGFEVLPYATEDLVVAEKLVAVGCKIIMPWASPIGSGRGLNNPLGLRTLRARFPKIQLIVDAGLGAPSHAAHAMELGYDAVLLNSAVSLAQDPVTMAEAFAYAVRAGRLGYEAGLISTRNFARPSTPVVGTPFWHTGNSACL